MFIAQKKAFLKNPEGILCENRDREHTIPSGFLSKNSFCSINIDSLREFESDWIVTVSSPQIYRFLLVIVR